MPHLRNSIAYDHDFWYTCIKQWYLQVFLFVFSKFWFSRLLGDVKGQKMAQNNKNCCLMRFISEESYIIWLSFMVDMCKMIISLGLFSVFESFDFPGCCWGGLGIGRRWGGGAHKEQKLVQNDKKILMISPGLSFFILSEFWFYRFLVGQKAKNDPKWQKALWIPPHISGTIHHIYDCNLYYTSV